MSAADECTDGVDSCEMTKDPVGMNKDGHLCYGKKKIDPICFKSESCIFHF